MSSTSIVGEFRNQTTGATCTVIRLTPSSYQPGNECYVTDEAEYLEPDPADPQKFMTLSGEVLIAAN
ncbi:MAG TPA: hypothetical protein VGO72_07010 [Herminiimonas sp.]|jgi:hypothetical protein|nr:hypothetical protein [Herminiimonas sp.]